jgi:outer membrane cobalamin receptor
MDVIHWLYANGYRSITMVAGSDGIGSFQELLPKYNGVEGVNGAYYKFDSIDFVSSGERDPDADGIAGVSASSAREAAANNDLQAFAQATGAGKLAQPLYDAVRKGMLLTDLELTECSGYIPKNKKEAKDPRWSNSLTVDIKPGAINKNLKALRLI